MESLGTFQTPIDQRQETGFSDKTSERKKNLCPCDSCKGLKRRCEGKAPNPCAYCTKRNYFCVYSTTAGGVENIQQFVPNKQHVSRARRSVPEGGRAINSSTPSTSQFISSTGYSTTIPNAASSSPAGLSPQVEPERSPADPELVLGNVNLFVFDTSEVEQEVGQYATTPGMLAQTTVESDESDKISYGVLPADGSLASYYAGIQQDTYDTYMYGLDDVQAGEGVPFDGLAWNQDIPADSFTANQPASSIPEQNDAPAVTNSVISYDIKTNEEYSKAYLAGHEAFASMM